MDENPNLTATIVLRQLENLIKVNDAKYQEQFNHLSKTLEQGLANVWRNHEQDVKIRDENIATATKALEAASNNSWRSHEQDVDNKVKALEQLIQSLDRRFEDQCKNTTKNLDKGMDNLWRNHEADMLKHTDSIKVAFAASEVAIQKAEDYKERWRQSIEAWQKIVNERIYKEEGQTAGHKDSWTTTVAIVMILISFATMYIHWNSSSDQSKANGQSIQQVLQNVQGLQQQYDLVDKHLDKLQSDIQVVKGDVSKHLLDSEEVLEPYHKRRPVTTVDPDSDGH